MSFQNSIKLKVKDVVKIGNSLYKDILLVLISYKETT